MNAAWQRPGPDRPLRVGDVVPMDRRYEPLGEDIPPVWLALLVPPRKDFAAVDFLKRKGLMAFAPSVTRVRYRRGVRNELRLPAVPGLVVAKFTRAPQWEALRSRRIVNGVLSQGGVPVALDPDQVRRIDGLSAALAERLRCKPGDLVRLARGPLAGYLVEVTAVRGSKAICTALGINVVLPIDEVEDAKDA